MVMTPQRLVELATAALQVPTDLRQAYVARECGEDTAAQLQVQQIMAICDGAAASAAQSSAADLREIAIGSTVAAALSRSDGPASTVQLGSSDSTMLPHAASSPDTLGNHEIIEPLGRGGMGLVYKARHRALNRIVALKVILAGPLADTDDIQRFHTEAQAAARLDHPGIVPVYEVGQFDGRPYFTMGFVDGPTLAQFLGARPIDPQQAAQLSEKISRAVHYAHEHGVVHRDLKPSNILLDQDGTPRISDFGLAKLTASDSGLTITGQVMGTPCYMAPEQAAGKPIDARADIYSLGAILYACLTGRPPFEAATAVETLRQVQQVEAVAPRQLNPAIPRDLETICLKCLEKDAARRYPTAAALGDELARFLAGEPIQARPIGRLERVSRWSKRNPREATLVGALLAILLCTSVGSAIAAVLINSARSAAVVAHSAAEKSNRDALQARDVARRNERQAKQLLSESYVQAAGLAAQRGQWRVALDKLNRALQTGHRDVVGVRLERAEAYEALNDVSNSRDEIAWLARQPNLGQRRGAVLLWQGDLAFPRGEQAQAIELVKQAQAAGLNAADGAYAAALLAETTPASIEALETTLQHDPFHHRATRLLAFLLLLSGRHDEAQQRVEAARLLFPDDGSFELLSIASDAARGDAATARERLLPWRERLGADYATMETIVSALAFADTAAADWDGGFSSFEIAKQLIQFLTALQRAYLQGQQKDVSPLAFALTPAITKALVPLRQATLISINPLVFNRDEQVAALLRESSAHHPEGTVYFMQAASLVASGNYAKAEEYALLAAETPAVVPAFRREAYFVAAMSQAAQSALEGKPDKMPLAVANVRRRLAFGNVRPLHGVYMRKIAESAGEFTLARQLCELLLAAEPNNAQYLADRARVELKAGNPLAAIEFADRALLAKDPPPEATATRATALLDLRAKIEHLAAAGTGQ